MTHFGDLCYNPANLKFGVICLNKYGDAIFSPIYITFEIADEYDVDFIGANLSRWNFINRALRFQQGTVYERMAVSPEDFLTIKCHFPSKREQNRLSEFIGLLDERIAKQQQLVESLKKYKRGLLSYYFSSKYIGHHDDIESYAFADLACRRTEKYDPRSGKDIACIELEHLEQETGRILGSTPAAKQNSIKNVCKKGDVLFGKLRPYLRKYAFVKHDCVCSSEIWALVPTERVLPQFLFYLVQSEDFIRVTNISSGTKMPRAEWSNVEKAVFNIPSTDVQQVVILQIEGTDALIKNNDKILECLKSFRQGLLQQLFI